MYTVKSNLIEKNDIAGIADLDDILEWVEYESEGATIGEVQSKCEQLTRRFGITVEGRGRGV